MRTTLLSIFGMAVTTLGAAVFFVHTMGAPAHLGGPLLSKYAAGWRTAPSAEQQPAAPPKPLDNVTIINAAPH
jgi:hypothetical protein